jgi:hypothetical protein
MAQYRNRCLDVLRRELPHFDFAVVVDTDLQGGWSYDGIANTFGHDSWDFVGSNGIIFKRIGAAFNAAVQYDAWAFRTDEAFTPHSTADVNSLAWERGEPLVPVTSCFGGLGVYRMAAYLSARYDGWDTEHVPLHSQMRAAGFTRCFLNPSQITVYGRHPRKSDRWAMPCVRLLSACRSYLSSRPAIAPLF